MRARFAYSENDDPGEDAHHHGFVSQHRGYSPAQHERIAKWCEERFGEARGVSSGRWSQVRPLVQLRVGFFFFQDADAAFEFKMRWA